MRNLRTAAGFCALVMLMASSSGSPAIAKKKAAADKAAKAAVIEHPADVSNSLDELLTSPSKSSPDITAPQPVKAPEKLQGAVEATDGNTAGTALEARTDGSYNQLHSGVNEDGTSTGIRSGINDEGQRQTLQPKLAPQEKRILQGSAALGGLQAGAQQDPDSADRELMVEWDRWRNRFLRAVQLQVQAGVNHPDDWEEQAAPRPQITYDPYTGQPVIQPRFPMGTEAWFKVDITADRRVKNLSIIRPSGINEYDRAVLSGVRALEGTSMLEFPSSSRRPVVTQSAGIKTAESSGYQYHHFGDVERLKQ